MNSLQFKDTNMSSRRDFLRHSALVSLAPLVPAFLTRSAMAADIHADERALVVIQLDGGNDGLNTVIPYADENYARFRRELRMKTDEIIKLDDAVGLHPAMKAAAELYNDGRLAIVQGVGYPNPNRSHFESMAIWHHARLKTDEHDGNGWLGRAAELARVRNSSTPDSIYVGADTVPAAIRGRRANATALQSESDLHLTEKVAGLNLNSPQSLDVADFVQRTVDQSFNAARQFRESSQAQKASAGDYPQSRLAEKLRLVSKLLQLGGGTRIYYVSQPGYDTHAAQIYQHSQLLREFAGALKAFLNDLKASKLDERVIVLAFSEFGRRVEENGSAGTDHGAAAPVFIAGSRIRPNQLGRHPSLADLDQGDLKMSIDFRKLYATLLDQWLGISSMQVLGADFGHVSVIS
jgi:uncharacterized protein (DUF1501 family)